MLTVKDAFYERHVKSETGAFSWSTSDRGNVDETVQHTEIHPRTSLQIVTADGLVVEYRETGNVREDIAQLAQSPGLAWMGELLQREDVDWQKVQEVHDAWKGEQSGVGGPGVMLVSLAVAVALAMTGVDSRSCRRCDSGIADGHATGDTLCRCRGLQLPGHAGCRAAFGQPGRCPRDP